jgi:PKD repeat protein
LLVDGGAVNLINTIIANHSLGILQTAGTVNANTTLFYDNVLNTQGSGITNNNPRAGNPVFFNPLLQDYHLGFGSAAVNSGTNSGVGIDFDGDSRPQGSGFDIGYDESVAPEGLVAANDSPTRFGTPTTFSASVTFGQAISYAWDFGDGSTGSGSLVEHVYANPGSYHVTVTAANGAGSLNASTDAQVVFSLYLPVLEK